MANKTEIFRRITDQNGTIYDIGPDPINKGLIRLVIKFDDKHTIAVSFDTDVITDIVWALKCSQDEVE